MVAARLATQAVVLYRAGRLDAPTLFASIDWPKLAAQVIGSGAAMTLASSAVAAGLLPALALGPVALVPLAAGIAGGWLAEKLVDWWRRSPAATPAPPARPAPGLAMASPSGARSPDTDPFADLRLSSALHSSH